MSLRLHCICALLIYLYIVYLCMYWHVCVFNTIHLLVVLHPVLFFYVFPVYGLFYLYIVITFLFVFISLLMLYLCLLKYVFVLYTLYSLVVLHIGNICIHISYKLFFMTLPPLSLTFIWNSLLTPACLDLPFICHMH